MGDPDQQSISSNLSLLTSVDAGKILPGPRILSLDGGGVQGLSSLLILREIMREIERRTGTLETPRPCDYFDLIGGTGTGGWIAIMLGLLGMVQIPIMEVS
jgi:Patatin-like phospholipase